jgi:hypothetical protein
MGEITIRQPHLAPMRFFDVGVKEHCGGRFRDEPPWYLLPQLRLSALCCSNTGGMNYIEREIVGLEPDVALIGAGASRKEIYDCSGRLMRDLHYPAIVLPTHWDNFLAPFEASQQPALEAVQSFV